MEKQTSPRDPSARFDPKGAAQFLLSGGHPGWLGLTYRGHGDDWSELTLPWREDLVGDDVRRVMLGVGFELLQEERRECVYASHPQCMKKTVFDTVFFVARKKE